MDIYVHFVIDLLNKKKENCNKVSFRYCVKHFIKKTFNNNDNNLKFVYFFLYGQWIK